MQISAVIPDHHGTTFGLKQRITTETKDKLAKTLKKFGSVMTDPEDEFAFAVLHGRDISAENIKEAIIKLN